MSNQLAVLLSTFALLGSAGLLLLSLLVLLWALLRGDRRLTRLTLLGAGGLATGYLVLLGSAALLSRDRRLAPGSEKVFCEIDCHVGYSIARVDSGGPVAEGASRLWIVTVRTRFDETTISPERGREAPLQPSPRLVLLRDAAGAVHGDLSGAVSGDSGSTPLTTPLRPGESYLTRFRFELPAGVPPDVLLLEDADGISAALIGHERSPWHGKVLLALPAPAA